MKIAIVGLRYGQQHLVAKGCKGLADLVFVDADRADISFPAADTVIVMTKFIQHRWTQVAFQTFPRDRVHLHDGGVSKLMRKIKRIAAGNHAVEQRQR